MTASTTTGKVGKDDRGKVQHTYKDHSQVTMYEVETHHVTPTCGVGGERNFPGKLHYMLCNHCNHDDDLGRIISWQPHGRCFLVHEPYRFVKEILPLWFRQTKFASFQRQLNLYGFARLTVGPDKGAYYHDYFLRGKMFLCQKLKRVKVKNTGARKPSSPNTEPNFYRMPYLPYRNEVAEPRRQESTGEPLPPVAPPVETATHPGGLVSSHNPSGEGLDRTNSVYNPTPMPTASLANMMYALPPQHSHIMFAHDNSTPSVVGSSLALVLAFQQQQQQQRAPAERYPEDMILRVSIAMAPPSFQANAQWLEHSSRRLTNIAGLQQTLAANHQHYHHHPTDPVDPQHHHHPRPPPMDPSRADLLNQLERMEASHESRLVAFLQHFG